MPARTPATAYMAVTRAQGELLFLLARAAGARRIVEFGCSFGVSTLYLTAAARDCRGSVVTSEMVPSKCRATEEALRRAGLASFATVLEGDACETLRDVEGPIDLVFLDGAKERYGPVFELLRPKLRPGALVVADNADMPQARGYVDRMRARDAGIVSVPLFAGRTLVSCLAT
jgi:predicted O-methyltransferase YrrM